ncbi:MAG: radical SAM protein [Armatimonadota bacterium]|nr:radical SAM protein [Armatimonadota bacterium]
MANVSITLDCERGCPYCFAKQAREHYPSARPMTPETFGRVLDCLSRSGIDQARLLGGEPTAHPEFETFVGTALERGFGVFVFTSGMMPESSLRCLRDAPREKIIALINVNAPGQQSEAEAAAQSLICKTLGERVTLGFNIHNRAPDLNFLLEQIDRYGLNRSIRLGLAHPCASSANRYLHPKRYPEVGLAIAEFNQRAAEADVRIDFDCGFVPCMFPDGWLESAGYVNTGIGKSCNIVPDILPNSLAVPCYPLASTCRTEVEDGADVATIRAELTAELAAYRRIGIYPECATCPWRANDACDGGCVSASMKRLRSGDFSFALPEAGSRTRPGWAARKPDTDGPKRDGLWVIPYVDQDMGFWEDLARDFGDSIKEVYLPLPGEVVGSGRPPQPSERVSEFLQARLFDVSVLVNPITLQRPVEETAPVVIDTLKRLADEFRITGVTVTNLSLARRIREQIPDLSITASVLMDIADPLQAVMIDGVCDALVPASRVMRNLAGLRSLRDSFAGRIRLIVNEACLPGCPLRVQHFHEMGDGFARPESLCSDILASKPWLRLTGAWVLPQHLRLYDGLYDELKLVGRSTLRDPAMYRYVLGNYVTAGEMTPDEIGGGPASPLEPYPIEEEFFASTLNCDHKCNSCRVCRDYYDRVSDAVVVSPS